MKPLLFSNLAEDRLHLVKDGRPQYSKIKEIVGLNDADFAKGTRIPITSLKSGEAKLPKGFLEILLELANAINIVAVRLGSVEKVDLWFKLKNPELGSISPRDMIKFGRFKKLIQLVHNANDGYHE